MRLVPFALAAMALALVVAACLAPRGMERIHSEPPPAGVTLISDTQLYKNVSARVAEGEDYYEVSADENRRHGYWLVPFFTVRPPAFAWFASIAPLEAAQFALFGLCCVLWILYPGLRPYERVLLAPAMAMGGWHVFMGPMWLHEYWAGLLLAISLAVYRQDRWWISVVPALLAALIREFAIPFLLLAGAFAIFNRRWHEFAGWTAATLAIVAYLGWHAWQVAGVTLPSDLSATGWGAVVGPSQAMAMTVNQSLLRILPDTLDRLVLALSIIGWLGLRNRTGAFAFLYLCGMLLMIAIGAKPENFAWPLMLFPLWAGGIVFVPRLIGLLFDQRTAIGPAHST